jgi:hypothetical protein
MILLLAFCRFPRSGGPFILSNRDSAFLSESFPNLFLTELGKLPSICFTVYGMWFQSVMEVRRAYCRDLFSTGYEYSDLPCSPWRSTRLLGGSSCTSSSLVFSMSLTCCTIVNLTHIESLTYRVANISVIFFLSIYIQPRPTNENSRKS